MTISLEGVLFKIILVNRVIKKIQRLSCFNYILTKSNLKIDKMAINSMQSDAIMAI
jgi:hypothetical protein